MQFQAPQNQQKPSDHDKLATSNPNRHNFQTISKICTANFKIMEKPKKRYIIRAYTQGSGSAGNQRKRPDDHRERPDRKSFQILETILIFCGRGFANRHFTETDSLYASLSRLSRPLPEYLFTKAIKSDLQLTATYGNLNTGSATSTMLCQPLPSYAKFAKNGFFVFKKPNP